MYYNIDDSLNYSLALPKKNVIKINRGNDGRCCKPLSLPSVGFVSVNGTATLELKLEKSLDLKLTDI